MKDAAEFDAFLKRAKHGYGHTYQLHRKLGGAFIDVAFYTEDHALSTFRLLLPEPVSVKQELKWDESHFPYELETYRVGEKTIEVKLYRPLFEKVALTHFLEDVASGADMDKAPDAIKSAFFNIRESVKRIVETIKQLNKELPLTSEQRQAIELFFGNADIWCSVNHFEDDLELAISEFLVRDVEHRAEEYDVICNREADLRRKSFCDIEDQLLNGYKQRLEGQGFREGFVSLKDKE